MAKMRNGECRVTRNGQRYCKRGGRVRFVKGGGRSRSRSLSGSRGRKGRTCIRRKRVRMRSGGTSLRCAKYSK